MLHTLPVSSDHVVDDCGDIVDVLQVVDEVNEGAGLVLPQRPGGRCGVGVAGLFIETHEAPDRDPGISDGPNMVPLREFEGLMAELMAIDRVVKGAR